MEQKTTVSIFGACVSRDLFAMQRPETYEVQQYVSFVSPLSAVMTPPINGIQLNPDKIEPNQEENLHFLGEIWLLIVISRCFLIWNRNHRNG